MGRKQPDKLRARKNQSGAALVEFGFVLMPTLGFPFLLIALAWMIFAWACVQEAVREGARTAVTCTPATGLDQTIQNVVEQYSFGFVNSGNVDSVFSVEFLDPTTFNQISSNITTGDIVKVSISNLPVYTFAPIMRDYSQVLIGATSADIMSCPSPGSP